MRFRTHTRCQPCIFVDESLPNLIKMLHLDGSVVTRRRLRHFMLPGRRLSPVVASHAAKQLWPCKAEQAPAISQGGWANVRQVFVTPPTPRPGPLYSCESCRHFNDELFRLHAGERHVPARCRVLLPVRRHGHPVQLLHAGERAKSSRVSFLTYTRSTSTWSRVLFQESSSLPFFMYGGTLYPLQHMCAQSSALCNANEERGRQRVIKNKRT